MRRRNKRPFLTPLFSVLSIVLITAALMLFLNGASRGDRARELAALTPTPTLVPRKVSYAYDTMTPAPTALLVSSGKEGPVVVTIQECLSALGYYTGAIDGQFGAQTREAVVRFQKDMGLTADGMVGEQTYSLLLSKAALPGP